MIHAVEYIGRFGKSLCGTGCSTEAYGLIRWHEGHSGVVFPEHRYEITCLECTYEVSRRMDGTPLSVLPLCARARNCFAANGYYTIECIESMSDDELLRSPNFGKVSLAHTRELIRQWRERNKLEPLDFWDYPIPDI